MTDKEERSAEQIEDKHRVERYYLEAITYCGSEDKVCDDLISNIIDNLPPNKSPGLDGITA